MRKVSVFLLAALWAMPTLARADFINGGFETGNFTGWTQSGNTGFTGVDTVFPHSGSFAAFFGPTGSLGFIDQSLSTTVGNSYTLSYWLTAEGGTGPTNTAEVLINGVDVPSLHMTNVGPFGYTNFTYTFTADAALTNFKFGFQNDPSFFDLDDVHLLDNGPAAPAPAGVVLAGLGFVAVGGWSAWRKRRSAAAC